MSKTEREQEAKDLVTEIRDRAGRGQLLRAGQVHAGLVLLVRREGARLAHALDPDADEAARVLRDHFLGRRQAPGEQLSLFTLAVAVEGVRQELRQEVEPWTQRRCVSAGSWPGMITDARKQPDRRQSVDRRRGRGVVRRPRDAMFVGMGSPFKGRAR